MRWRHYIGIYWLHWRLVWSVICVGNYRVVTGRWWGLAHAVYLHRRYGGIDGSYSKTFFVSYDYVLNFLVDSVWQSPQLAQPTYGGQFMGCYSTCLSSAMWQLPLTVNATWRCVEPFAIAIVSHFVGGCTVHPKLILWAKIYRKMKKQKFLITRRLKGERSTPMHLQWKSTHLYCVSLATEV